jgi:imidazolonepropionase-like amidohydrolase
MRQSYAGILWVAAALGLVVSLHAQERPIPAAVRPFVSVNAAVVALTHVQLVDGTGAPARADQTVILRGSTIESVGPFATTTVPSGARVLDLSGHTIMPGQVGLHEHTYFASIDAATGRPTRIAQMNVSAPLLYLAYGVTTAMTAGSPLPYHELNLKRAVDAGDTPGPRFHIAGPYLNGPSAAPWTSRNAVAAMFQAVTTVEEVQRVIGYWGSEGATWVKFMGTVTTDMLRAGVQTAHARGMRVTGHLCSVTFTEAAAVGIDLLQHGFVTNSEYVPEKQPDLCPPGNQRVQADVDVSSAAVQESIQAIVAAGAAVASTLAPYETFMPGRVTLDTRTLETLAPDTRKEVEAIRAGLAESAWALPPRLLKKMMQWEQAFVAAGGLLGAGSDPWGTGLVPGVGNMRNFELLVEAGFTPEQAIQIMTLNGARILGIDQRVGSIAPGKTADLVVIQGDPVRRATDIYSVVTVFRDGLGYDSERLRKAAAQRVGAD